MGTGKICSFTSHLRGMQNILATAVLPRPLVQTPNLPLIASQVPTQ